MAKTLSERIETPRNRRSFTLWILLLGIFIFTLVGWLRMYEAFIYREWWDVLQIRPGSVYHMVSGGLWGGAGMVCLAGLWYKTHWAARFTILTAVVFVGFYWLDYLLFVQSPGARSGVLFAIGASIIGLGLVIGILQLPRQRRYFSE